MANRTNDTSKPRGTADNSGRASDVRTQIVAAQPGRGGSRNDTLDEDLNRERLEPGLNAEGTGGAGADPAKPKDGNSTHNSERK